jgi:sugar phosphate isomerase/epimerase
MAYGVLITLVPTEHEYEALPEGSGWRPEPGEWRALTPYETAMRSLLNDIARRAAPLVESLGGRTLASHTPRATPAATEQVNVWIDDAGDTLAEAIGRAGECASVLEQAGLEIKTVEQINWKHTPIIA